MRMPAAEPGLDKAAISVAILAGQRGTRCFVIESRLV
jgi:hypothetical protein